MTPEVIAAMQRNAGQTPQPPPAYVLEQRTDPAYLEWLAQQPAQQQQQQPAPAPWEAQPRTSVTPADAWTRPPEPAPVSISAMAATPQEVVDAFKQSAPAEPAKPTTAKRGRPAGASKAAAVDAARYAARAAVIVACLALEISVDQVVDHAKRMLELLEGGSDAA